MLIKCADGSYEDVSEEELEAAAAIFDAYYQAALNRRGLTVERMLDDLSAADSRKGES